MYLPVALSLIAAVLFGIAFASWIWEKVTA